MTMSIFKVVGSILDVSGDVAQYVMGQVRYIRADSAIRARHVFQDNYKGIADHVSLIGPNYAARIGSARVYDDIASPIGGDGISSPEEIYAYREGRTKYTPTRKARARCVAIKHARAETGASKAMAKAGRRIAEAQRRAGMPVRVKA